MRVPPWRRETGRYPGIVSWLPAILVLSLAAFPAAGQQASVLFEKLRTAGLDPEECYRVRDLMLLKEDARLYFTEGFLIFGKPVEGRRISAVFSGEVESGDGEILVMPPVRSERLSLATFTESPNLNEHFRFALMIFSDDTADQLYESLRKQPRERKSPERGALLADQFSGVTGNMVRSFGSRMVYDLLAERSRNDGFFYAGLRGVRHGNFDFIYDPIAQEQIQIGKVNFRGSSALFDVWTSFASRSFREGARRLAPTGFRLSDYRIDARLGQDLKLDATTDAVLEVVDGARRAFYFELSPSVRMEEVVINGQRCEVWQQESLRADLFGGGSASFLAVAPEPLPPGRHGIRFRHGGEVVSEAGNGVYYVGSRNTWYPFLGTDFSHFDITFRYPAGLNLVFPGKVVEDRSEGEWRVTRRRPENPIRLVGFNVGAYESLRVERDGFTIEVYANRKLEDALAPRPKVVFVPRTGMPGPRRGVPDVVAVPVAPDRPDPTASLERLAGEVADAFQFMKENFGEPPVSTLMVSPIPGGFGQGFPGLLYLSTMSYLEPHERPEEARNSYHEYFFSDILHAHETAHQWWGNAVTSHGYQDGWLMEALANYSAMLMAERRKGPEALTAILDQYRQHLLSKNEQGKTIESAGPITWGPRLNSSQARAYRVITYEKGSWILHMLRRRLGDDLFLRMLGDLYRDYRYQPLTTDEFRRHAARYVPANLPDRALEGFFDVWVYDVGIPELKLDHRIRGAAPRVRVTGTIEQSGVPAYFTTLALLELQLPGGKQERRWIRTSEEPAPFDITVAERPLKVVLNPGQSVLTAR